MCHNRGVNVERTGRNEGCQGWTTIKCPPALPAQRVGARNDRSAHPAGKRRGRARISEPCQPFRCRSHPIKVKNADQSDAQPPANLPASQACPPSCPAMALATAEAWRRQAARAQNQPHNGSVSHQQSQPIAPYRTLSQVAVNLT